MVYYFLPRGYFDDLRPQDSLTGEYLDKESLLYIDQTWDQNQCWVLLVYTSEGLGARSFNF